MSLLSLIPEPLHRLLYRAAHGVRSICVRSLRMEVSGCSIVALDVQGRVLLVRHSYGNRAWTVPGGGMRAGEDPLIAAAREFREELGSALEQPRLLGVQREPYHGGIDNAHVVAGLIGAEPRPDMREIVDACFFERGKLPQDCAPLAVKRLALLDEI